MFVKIEDLQGLCDGCPSNSKANGRGISSLVKFPHGRRMPARSLDHSSITDEEANNAAAWYHRQSFKTYVVPYLGDFFVPNCGARFQGHLVRAKKKKEEMVLGLKHPNTSCFFNGFGHQKQSFVAVGENLRHCRHWMPCKSGPGNKGGLRQCFCP